MLPRQPRDLLRRVTLPADGHGMVAERVAALDQQRVRAARQRRGLVPDHPAGHRVQQPGKRLPVAQRRLGRVRRFAGEGVAPPGGGGPGCLLHGSPPPCGCAPRPPRGRVPRASLPRASLPRGRVARRRGRPYQRELPVEAVEEPALDPADPLRGQLCLHAGETGQPHLDEPARVLGGHLGQHLPDEVLAGHRPVYGDGQAAARIQRGDGPDTGREMPLVEVEAALDGQHVHIGGQIALQPRGQPRGEPGIGRLAELLQVRFRVIRRWPLVRCGRFGWAGGARRRYGGQDGELRTRFCG